MRDRSPSRSGRVRSSSDSPTPEEVVIHDTSDFLPIEQRTMLTGDTRQSENFETGVDGWYQDGEGNAEFNNVLLRGELVIFDGTTEIHLDSNGLTLPPNPSSPFDIEGQYTPVQLLSDVRWEDDADTYAVLTADEDGTFHIVSTSETLPETGIRLTAVNGGDGCSIRLFVPDPNPFAIGAMTGSLALTQTDVVGEPMLGLIAYPQPWSMYAGGLIDSNTTNIAVTSFTATSTVIGSNAVNLRPGRRYRANCWVGYNVTNANTRVNATMDLSSGTSSIDIFPNSNVILTPGATTTRTFVGSWEFEPKSSTTTTLNASVRIRFARRDGTGNLNTVSNVEAAFISVEDIGPASYNITN